MRDCNVFFFFFVFFFGGGGGGGVGVYQKTPFQQQWNWLFPYKSRKNLIHLDKKYEAIFLWHTIFVNK